MIRANSITIQEFRGIRKLTLDFKGESFAVCGRNGTGKSGVIDALEFALTGDVSRLSGRGTGEFSLKDHGPHVNSRSTPDKACVSMNITIPSLDKTVTIERSVKSPSTLKVIPDDPEVREVLNRLEEHPEFVLARRELIRYIIATPADRAGQVQALLKLERVEKVRKSLQKIANASEDELSPTKAATATARDQLCLALGIAELLPAELIKAVNIQRSIMGLPLLEELTPTTSLKDGMSTANAAQIGRTPRAVGLADIRATRDAIFELSKISVTPLIERVKTELSLLASDPFFSSGVKMEDFYRSGVDLIVGGACPFCDQQWDAEGLKKHVEEKRAHLSEVLKKRKQLEESLSPISQLLTNAQGMVELISRHGAGMIPAIPMTCLGAYSQSLVKRRNALNAFLPLQDTMNALSEIGSIQEGIAEELNSLDRAFLALPEATKQDGARDWLTISQERLSVYRDARRKQQVAESRATQARKASDVYVRVSDEMLQGIYKEVENDFANLYRQVNNDDESGFTAKLIPSMGKLGFDVDFHGKGAFPPGAYHSEGHQDGMGLCLYLALMRYMQGDQFTFAALDDVLMSVDAGHRREVCKMLKKEFPQTQFILTTHDATWLRHMKTEALITNRASTQFKTWDVEYGPAQLDSRDIWTEIDEYQKTGDIRNAAGALRHYLEYESRELCDRLRASVAFREDSQYELGDLLPRAISRMKKLYREAKDAANSWNQAGALQLITDRESGFATTVAASQVEQWQVNVAIHFNGWDNLVSEDFAPVAKAFRELVEGFRCPDCKEFLYVSPVREEADMLRCDCGKTNFNLKKK